MGIANIWVPLALTDKESSDRDNSWFSAVGRLKPGVTQQQAEANVSAAMGALEKEFPLTNKNVTMLLSPLTYEIGKEEGAEQVQICMWIVALDPPHSVRERCEPDACSSGTKSKGIRIAYGDWSHAETASTAAGH